MAEAVAAAIAWIGANSALVYFVVSVAVSVYGSAQARRAAADAAEQARREFNAGLRDRTITRIATDAPFRYVYGRARVGSNIVAVFTSGDKDQYKHLVCVHADHECDAFEEVYINGEALGTLDSNGFVDSGKYFKAHTDNIREFPSGGSIGPGTTHANDVIIYRAPITALSFTIARTPDGGKVSVYERFWNSDGDNATGMYKYEYIACTVVGTTVTLAHLPTDWRNVVVSYVNSEGTSYVRVKQHLGTPTDTADTYLMSVVPDKWPSTALLRGKCYSVVTLDLNEAEFQGGIPPIEVTLRGKKLYDLRDGVTRWSSNPALVVYDYLTSPICNVPASDIPVSSYITAANVCDETSPTVVSYNGSLISLGLSALYAISPDYKYTINGAITSDQDKSKILEMMAQAMAGGVVSTTWDIWAGKYVAPVASLYQEDIVGAVAITPGISDADIYNGVMGQYIDPVNKYVATDYVPYQNAIYLAQDGRDLYNSIDFPFTDNKQRAHNLCRIFTEDHRNAFTIKANFSLKAWPLKVGQRVTFTSAFFGHNAKVFRITDKSFSPESAIELTLKEDAPSIWDEADATTAESTPNTDLADPFVVSPIESIVASSGTDVLMLQGDGTIVSRILVSWPIATTPSVVNNGFIEVEWQAITEVAWQRAQVSGSDTQMYITSVEEGQVYTIRARAVNPYLNVKSNWVYITHSVVGKTEAPPNVTSLLYDRQSNTLSWGNVVALDLAGYEVRYTIGAGSWDTAIVVTSTTKSVTSINPVIKTQYDVTFYVKAKDTTGNYSDVAATTVASLVSADLTSLTINGTVLSWSTSDYSNVIGYAFRFNYGNNVDWGSAVPLHNGVITQSPFDLVTRPNGVVTIMGKAVDSNGNESNATANIVTDLGDTLLENIVEVFDIAGSFNGTKTNCTVIGGELLAENVDAFYGADNQAFYGLDSEAIYEPATFKQMVYITDEIVVTKALVGSRASLLLTTQGDGLFIEYRMSSQGPFYESDTESFYGADASSLYSPHGEWMPWPGSIVTTNDGYQFRVTIGSSLVRGTISTMSFVVDAPDIIETIQDLVISDVGTTIPFSSNFTSIRNVQATLQSNTSGAVTVDVDKSNPLAPVIKAYNTSHTAVSGATADITLKGY